MKFDSAYDSIQMTKSHEVQGYENEKKKFESKLTAVRQQIGIKSTLECQIEALISEKNDIRVKK